MNFKTKQKFRFNKTLNPIKNNSTTFPFEENLGHPYLSPLGWYRFKKNQKSKSILFCQLRLLLVGDSKGVVCSFQDFQQVSHFRVSTEKIVSISTSQHEMKTLEKGTLTL